MNLHPDAVAILRAVFDRPTDETPRLVLADWLDDSGIPEYAGWAGYIRVRSRAARLPVSSPERTALLHDAERHTTSFTATLTVPAESFVRDPAAFLDLLPTDRLTVSLDGFVLPAELLDAIPDSVARYNRVVSLSPYGERLYLAAANPNDPELIQRLEFIMNRPIVFVRAAGDEIDRAIDAGYPFAEVESVTEELLVFPDPPASRMTHTDHEHVATLFVNLMLLEAVRCRAAWLEIRPETADWTRVWYRVENEWHGRDTIARSRLGAVVARLAEMGSLVARADGTYPGSATVAFVADGTAARFTLVIEPTPFGPWVGLEVLREPATWVAGP